ncbi:hypothetical protein JCM1840_006315 [Sporobolomyces johnsonii]
MDVFADPSSFPAPPAPPKPSSSTARRKPYSTSTLIDASQLPIFPPSIPAPYCIAAAALPSHLPPSAINHRPPLADASPNTLRPSALAAALPSSTSKARPSASGSKKSTTPAPVGADSPLYLAPDYLLNPAGPASSADTDFKCPQCDKVYKGKHARSIWRRHLQDKHGIPLSQQPRRTRWDNDANRPKSEEERRARTLDSKRKWARKNRAEKGSSVPGSSTGKKSAKQEDEGDSVPPPSLAGSVGTPASDNEGGVEDDEADGDSSFASVEGRGASAPVMGGADPFYPPPPSGMIATYGSRMTPGKAPLIPGTIDPYGLSRHPQHPQSRVPPPQYATYSHPHGEYVLDEHGYAHPAGVPPVPVGTYPPYAYSHNPYAAPFHQPHEQPHYPLGPSQHPSQLFPPASAAHEDPSNPLLPPRRPASTSALPNPYDHPAAAMGITAGQPAPVALSYYARRQSPARHASSLANALDSPVKLHRALPPKPAEGAGAAGAREGKDDAAGLLLALKAGPSSPMPALGVQSPVSAVRGATDEEEDDDDEDSRQVARSLVDGGVVVGAVRPPRRDQGFHQAAPAVSPRKRSRSESPAPSPLLASTSSGEGSTAAAHALLTAKKSHRPGAWHTSLVATPTPGLAGGASAAHQLGWREAMESSPAVRLGNVGAARAGAVAAGGAEGESEEGEAEDEFSSSGGKGQRRRGGGAARSRSESPSSAPRRGGAHRKGGSSSGGASTSSRGGVHHHHHPVGLTSELDDFGLAPTSSSSGGGAGYHHHDPLRETDHAGGGGDMLPPRSSSSSAVDSFALSSTPAHNPSSSAAAPSSSGFSALSASAAHALQLSQQHPPHPPHPHDPFARYTSALPSRHSHAAQQPTSSPPSAMANYFLFSSPAHPQFSRTLGLAAQPGPGVLYTNTGVGETPARGGGDGDEGGPKRLGRQREESGGSITGLSTATTSRRWDASETKTPVNSNRLASRPAGLIGHRRDDDSDDEEEDEEDEEGRGVGASVFEESSDREEQDEEEEGQAEGEDDDGEDDDEGRLED